MDIVYLVQVQGFRRFGGLTCVFVEQIAERKDKRVGYCCRRASGPWYFRTLHKHSDGVQQATTKYGGLSTAAAKAPPSVEMTRGLSWIEENRQQQKNFHSSCWTGS